MQYVFRISGSHLVLARIANRHAKASHARAGKLKVVVNEVNMRLWTYEDAPVHIQPKAASEVPQEMIAALEIRTSEKITGENRRIETKALRADSSLQLGLRVLSQRRSKHGIEIVKNRAVGLEEQIHVLMSAVSDFTAHTEVFFEEEEVPAEARVGAAANGLRRETN